MRIPVGLLIVVAAAPAALAQLPKTEPVPVDVALEECTAAYSTKPCADEINVKFRAPGAEQRSDRLVIRIDPGDVPRSGPRRMFLDMGQLKVYAEGGTITAISTAAPGKYAQMRYTPPLTPATLAKFLPPVPLPQLAMAGDDLKQLKTVTPYTPDLTWTSAEPDSVARPQTVTIQGSGPSGPATLTTSVETGRILKFTATVHGHSGESTLELTCRAVDPGDPASWAIKTDGRELVATVQELKPATAK